MQSFFPARNARLVTAILVLGALSSFAPQTGNAQDAGSRSAPQFSAPQASAPQASRTSPQPLALLDVNFPDAFVGTPFHIGIQASGGSTTFQMSIEGKLPDGLTATTDGELIGIGGTPSTAGSFDVVATAVDRNGLSVSRTYSLHVVPASPFVTPPPLVINTSEVIHGNDGDQTFTPLKIDMAEVGTLHDAVTAVVALGISPATVPDGVYNTAYAFTLFFAVGNTGPVTYSESGAAPAGMTWSTSGGKPVLTGTPTVVGSFPFSITATDSVHTSVQPYAFAVDPAPQTISYGALPAPTYGDGPFTLTASATSGLSVAITPLLGHVTGSNPYTITGSGLATFSASQAGNAFYGAAPSLQANVNIAPATLNVTATSFSRVFDQPNPTYTYSFGAFVNGDNSAVLFGKPAIGSLAAPVSPVSGSPYTLTLTQNTLSALNYIFSLHNGTLTVTKAPQSITFYPLPTLIKNAVFTLSGRASSGLAVTYNVTGPATLSNGTLTVTGSGLITVTANQAGNANYSSAPAVTRSFTAP